jgi:hypothetical protein
MKSKIKQAYKLYLLMCHANGDIWWEDYKPFTFEEWIENGQPDNPGPENKNCKKQHEN